MAAQDRARLKEARPGARRDREPGIVQRVRDRATFARIDVFDQYSPSHCPSLAHAAPAAHEQYRSVSTRMPRTSRPRETSAMTELSFSTGEALVAFDGGLTIRSWNAAAERLTGIPAHEAIGRPCWDVLGGIDESGAVVCHAGCSNARLAREGWPVHQQELSIRAEGGRRRVALATIAVADPESPLFLHVLRELEQPGRESNPGPSLTKRQLEILNLVADGVPAKVIAERLGVAVSTVRNHIRAILVELDAHSQLEAVAHARGRGLLAR
jgi:DNA-binding CsgD family transcriptional regulator